MKQEERTYYTVHGICEFDAQVLAYSEEEAKELVKDAVASKQAAYHDARSVSVAREAEPESMPKRRTDRCERRAYLDLHTPVEIVHIQKQWVVQVAQGDFWIDTFDTRDAALHFCDEKGLHVLRTDAPH